VQQVDLLPAVVRRDSGSVGDGTLSIDVCPIGFRARALIILRFLMLPLVQVNISVECKCIRDVLRGDDVTEFRLKMLSSTAAEVYPYKEDD
jgi:hypothetical protein